jgi:hypothetical protein
VDLDNEQHIIERGGFYEFPYAVPRWSKNADEEYGRGPGHDALPDIRTLNRVKKLSLQALAKALAPPLLVLEDAVVGSVRMLPSSLNVVRELDAIKPLDSGVKFDVSSFDQAELRLQIREIFFSDLTTPSPVQGTPMSATEILQRFEMNQQKLGPVMGRLKSEMLQFIILRTYGIMIRAGAIEPPPPAVTEFFQEQGAIDLEIKYEGPLERAQQASDLVAVERAYSQILPISQVRPEVLDILNHDDIARRSAEVSGLPNQFILSKEVVASIRKQRAQLREQLMLAEEAERAGKTAKSIAQAGKAVAEAGAVEGEASRAAGDVPSDVI